MPDPLGRAMLDFARGRHRGNCYHRDGDTVWDANIYGFYFRPPGAWPDAFRDLLAALDGPVLDAGCGAGQHALFLQRDREVVALDVSPGAVQAARERGVEDARVGDMFDAAPRFGSNRFRSVLVVGTQAGLAGSLPALRSFLRDLDRVTTADARVVLDSYDPTASGIETLPGVRPDPREGLARRTFHVEYEYPAEHGWTREVGRTLEFLLFSPDRLRDVVEGTAWTVREVRPQSGYYRAVLATGADASGNTR